MIGCTLLLAEDLCLCGMERVSCQVFERDYWRSGEEKSMEAKVLDPSESEELTGDIIKYEDDNDNHAPSHGDSGTESIKR